MSHTLERPTSGSDTKMKSILERFFFTLHLGINVKSFLLGK